MNYFLKLILWAIEKLLNHKDISIVEYYQVGKAKAEIETVLKGREK